MSDLISKEALTNEIVNKKANSDGYNSAYQTYTTAYHSGSATRQLEILDIINKLPTISEQEIRSKAIDELSCKLMMYFADCQLIEEDAIVRDILDGVIERIDEIAERLKEVDNG